MYVQNKAFTKEIEMVMNKTGILELQNSVNG